MNRRGKTRKYDAGPCPTCKRVGARTDLGNGRYRCKQVRCSTEWSGKKKALPRLKPRSPKRDVKAEHVENYGALGEYARPMGCAVGRHDEGCDGRHVDMAHVHARGSLRRKAWEPTPPRLYYCPSCEKYDERAMNTPSAMLTCSCGHKWRAPGEYVGNLVPLCNPHHREQHSRGVGGFDKLYKGQLLVRLGGATIYPDSLEHAAHVIGGLAIAAGVDPLTNTWRKR